MKKVLLATDGSSGAEEAAWFLAHLPHSEKLELTVLTVVEAPYTNRSYPAPEWIVKAVESAKTSAVETFKEVEKMFDGSNAALRHVIREGNRGVCIVQVATEQKAELIVLGARGHSMVGRLLLGSTSDFVATHAHCSVVVVRPTGIRNAQRPLRIAIGYDESLPAQMALEEFAGIRWGRQTDVHVVSVVSYVTAFRSEVVVDDSSLMNAAASAVDQAADRLADAALHAKAHLIESDHVADGLVRFVEGHQCDLVVVGETPRNILGRLLLGSVTRFVLRHAPCSVWIMRNRVLQEIAEPDQQTHTASS